MQQILTYAFLVIYTVTILGIVLVIITDNRNPLKTLPWIIVLVFAPVVGLVFYFFFGQNLSKQRIISRRTRKRITMQLEEALDDGRPDIPDEHLPLATSTSRITSSATTRRAAACATRWSRKPGKGSRCASSTTTWGAAA